VALAESALIEKKNNASWLILSQLKAGGFYSLKNDNKCKQKNIGLHPGLMFLVGI